MPGWAAGGVPRPRRMFNAGYGRRFDNFVMSLFRNGMWRLNEGNDTGG